MDLELFKEKWKNQIDIQEKEQDKLIDNLVKKHSLVNNLEKNKAFAVKQKFILRHQQAIKNIKDLVAIPDEGEIVNILSNTQFNAYSFIPFILSQKKIKTLSVITYSITSKVIESLLDLQKNGEIETLNLFLSNHLLSIRPKIATRIIGLYDMNNKNINVGFTHSHAKITIMDNYVISGSGNMNKNSRLEQYFLSNSKEMSDFFIKTFFDKFKVTEKDRERLKNA